MSNRTFLLLNGLMACGFTALAFLVDVLDPGKPVIIRVVFALCAVSFGYTAWRFGVELCRRRRRAA